MHQPVHQPARRLVSQPASPANNLASLPAITTHSQPSCIPASHLTHPPPSSLSLPTSPSPHRHSLSSSRSLPPSPSLQPPSPVISFFHLVSMRKCITPQPHRGMGVLVSITDSESHITNTLRRCLLHSCLHFYRTTYHIIHSPHYLNYILSVIEFISIYIPS